MLEIEHLVAGYGESIVLDDVTLSVASNRVMALLGRNGMGKTTLLKAIMGLIRVRSGRVLLDGATLSGLRTEKIANRGIGYVPQGREIFQNFTVEENLVMGLVGRPGRRREAVPRDVLELFPVLDERRHQRAGSLSGGEQQQLAIARTLIGRPGVLLLDEPSEGIQPNVVEMITEVVRRLVATGGLSVLIVEQNVDMVRDLADEVAFIENRAIAAVHGVDELRAGDELVHRYLAL